MENKKEEKKEQKSFWTTVPGILTGCAAIITAIGGLVATLYAAGVILRPTPTPYVPPPPTTPVPTPTTPAPMPTTPVPMPTTPAPMPTTPVPTPTTPAPMPTTPVPTPTTPAPMPTTPVPTPTTPAPTPTTPAPTPTTPVPTPTTPTPAPTIVTLTSITAEHGHVRSDGTVNPYPNVGDTSTDLGAEAFLSFDISGIPAGSTILDVVVDFSNYDTLGDPLSSLGCLRAYPHDYGTLGSDDYFTGGPLGAILRFCWTGELSTPASDPDVKSALQGKVGASRFQLRLQFKDKETDNDGTADMVRFGMIKLTVAYSIP